MRRSKHVYSEYACAHGYVLVPLLSLFDLYLCLCSSENHHLGLLDEVLTQVAWKPFEIATRVTMEGLFIVIIHRIFSLARDWSKPVTWANIPQFLKLRALR